MHRKLIAAALAAVPALALVGCSTVTTGTVTVEVRSLPEDIAGKPIDITVRANGEIYETLTLDSGTTIALEAVPLGHTEIEATDFCSVASQMDELNPTMRLVLEDSGCTLTG